jgi:phosphoribosylamine--glycine ligase
VNESLKLVARGSNKDIYEIKGVPDHLLFRMSSRISVFDVGALDEDIPERGHSLERFALSVARHLKTCGVKQAWDAELSHKYQGFVQKRVVHAKVPSPSSTPRVFVPLEVIVRWGVPVGSSLVKKDPALFKVGTRFEKAQVDFTTKLEAQDRGLDKEEAQSLCPEGLYLENVENFVLEVGSHLQKFFSEKGLELWDAKFELAWDIRSKELLLVDAITPDELRLTLKGLDKVPLSKELLRFWLRQSMWYEEVLVAKSRGGDKWRENLPPSPRLGPWRSNFLSRVYVLLADLIEGRSHTQLLDLLRGRDPQVPQPKVCVLGGGGRETALRWRFENEGCRCVDKAEEADAVFVSLDLDLAEGVADELRARRLWTFGPSKAASKLEWSKIFGREIATQAGVPTPEYSLVRESLSSEALPVIKMDGLAAGKGVFLPETEEAFQEILKDLNHQKVEYLLEERCSGEEASVFFLIERDAWGRERARFLGSAKDFKRRYLGDEGPNTGGMGAYAPHPSLKPEDISVFRKWAEATASCMLQRQQAFRGILYLGLMRDPKKGWVLIEYNARLGDPETQALVALWPESQHVARSLLQLTPWTEWPDAIDEENASKSLCLALVHPDYPKSAEPLNLESWSFPSKRDLQVFQTSSRTGRVAYIVGQGASYLEAGDKVFDALLECPWKDQVEWRSDILR